MKKQYMNDEDFSSLKRSLEEAVAISQGTLSPARVTTLETPDVRQARHQLNLPRAEFARIMGVSPRTVEGWEQGRRQPKGAVSVLLRLALSHPQIVQQALKTQT
jgi:putative transcriptional regulator